MDIGKWRERLKADSCTRFGSSIAQSLHHLWKPPRRGVIRDEISRDFYNDLQDANKVKKSIKRKYEAEMVDQVVLIYHEEFLAGEGVITLCEKCQAR